MALTVTLEFTEEELDYFRAACITCGTGPSSAHRTRSPPQPWLPWRACVRRRVPVHPPPYRPGCAPGGDAGRPGVAVARLERGRVLDGLAYVADVQDLVPDDVPVLGLVDDAIMLELLLRELQHELDAYEEFDEYRRDEAPRRDKPGVHRPVSREDWLGSRREALHARIRERRDRDLARDGEAYQLITRF